MSVEKINKLFIYLFLRFHIESNFFFSIFHEIPHFPPQYLYQNINLVTQNIIRALSQALALVFEMQSQMSNPKKVLKKICFF